MRHLILPALVTGLCGPASASFSSYISINDVEQAITPVVSFQFSGDICLEDQEKVREMYDYSKACFKDDPEIKKYEVIISSITTSAGDAEFVNGKLVMSNPKKEITYLIKLRDLVTEIK